MTVASQVKQCFYSLKGVEENLITLSTKSTNKEAQDDLYQAALLLREVSDDINERLSKLEFEEPQYKGF